MDEDLLCLETWFDYLSYKHRRILKSFQSFNASSVNLVFPQFHLVLSSD